MSDNVNHPSHYASGKIEVIEAIEDWKLDFHSGNAIKYIARAGKKDPTKTTEDLKKAIWYISRRIELLDNPTPRRSNDMRIMEKNIKSVDEKMITFKSEPYIPSDWLEKSGPGLSVGDQVAARVDAALPFFPAKIIKVSDDTVSVLDIQSGKVYDGLPMYFIRKE